jgi:pimeloyl-ACP methyl ester carboxylesterase
VLPTELIVPNLGVAGETSAGGLRPAGPVVVLIHGVAGSSMAWRGQIGPLGRKCSVAAIELPGHGRSPGPPLARTDEMARWATQVIDAWAAAGGAEDRDAMARRVVLAGFSLGGAVALEMARVRPKGWAGLVVIGAGPVFPEAAGLRDRFHQDSEAARREFLELTVGLQVDPILLIKSRELLARVPDETWRADLDAVSSFDLRPHLADIRLPTLVLVGAKDRMTPPALAASLADGIPGARLHVIPNAGHMAQVERFAEVNRAILEFAQERTRIS